MKSAFLYNENISICKTNVVALEYLESDVKGRYKVIFHLVSGKEIVLESVEQGKLDGYKVELEECQMLILQQYGSINRPNESLSQLDKINNPHMNRNNLPQDKNINTGSKLPTIKSDSKVTGQESSNTKLPTDYITKNDTPIKDSHIKSFGDTNETSIPKLPEIPAITFNDSAPVPTRNSIDIKQSTHERAEPTLSPDLNNFFDEEDETDI